MILLALALLAADPSSLPNVIAGAKPGDVIRLVAGRYPILTIKNRTWVPKITVDASAASVTGVSLTNTVGLAWTGGEIVGDVVAGKVATGTGFGAGSSKDISIGGVHFSEVRLGISFDRVDGANLVGNWFTRITSDGIDLALSRNIVVDGNTCSEFMPSVGSHPDCIQMWSRPAMPPVADVQITNNTAIGALQGIGLFNHVRDGVDDGGYDRIKIENNTVLNIYSSAISMGDCRTCIVRNNLVNSLPNYIHKAQLIISRGSVVQCGNVVPLTLQGTPPCIADTVPARK